MQKLKVLTLREEKVISLRLSELFKAFPRQTDGYCGFRGKTLGSYSRDEKVISLDKVIRPFKPFPRQTDGYCGFRGKNSRFLLKR